MISLLKKTLWLFVVACGSASAGLAQSTYFEVASTPYDHQMQRVQQILTGSSAYRTYGPSLDAVNAWMTELRSMPYQYSQQWRTPFEVAAAEVGDCKGKAVLLYDWMQLHGATNLRLVIGKRRAGDFRTHAWLEWQTRVGTLLLDPTFNWNAAIKLSNPRTYVAFYGYEGRHKYRATDSVLVTRKYTIHTPASPAHGIVKRTIATRTLPVPARTAITRPVRAGSTTCLSPRAFDAGSLVDPRFCWNTRGL